MIEFNHRKLGDGHPCFITYEAGPTHDGVASAKRLIKHAAEAGADAIKFQIFDPDKLVADKQLEFSYDVLIDRGTEATETVSEPLYEILQRRSLSTNEWREVKKYSDELGLSFFATVGFEEDIDLLLELGCDSIKIASADVNHIPLLKRVAKTGLCIQLDTGNATLGEIETAVDVIRAEGNERIIIHNCPSGYPARLDSINLRLLATLKQMFPFPVAFSDHTPGWEMDVAAVAMGANLLEKTITEDRTTRSVEHIMSLEPSEMARFITTIRDVETAMGQPRRVFHPEEIESRQRVRRSIHLVKSVSQGQCLGDVAIEFRRPGFGISPDRYEEYAEARFGADLPAGHCLDMKDLIWS